MATIMLALALQCVFPLFQSEAARYLGLSVVNKDAQARDYTVTARNREGAGVQEVRFNLAPGHQRAFLLSEAMASPPTSGLVQVDSEASTCYGYLTFFDDLQSISAADAAAAAATELIAPHIEVHTGSSRRPTWIRRSSL